MQGAQVLSLVGEPRSHVMHGVAKTNKQTNKYWETARCLKKKKKEQDVVKKEQSENKNKLLEVKNIIV